MKTATKRHGVIVTRGVKHNSKSIYNRGHRMVTYRRQPKRICFKSKMVNDANQNLCGGWFLDGEGTTNERIERQLLAGRKPLGVMMFWDKDRAEAKACAKRLRAAGLVVRVGDLGDMIRIEACHDIRVGDIGDAGDLCKDYVEAGVLDGDEFCREANLHLGRKLKSYFGKLDIEDCPPWVTGLILGYPVENTISLYRGQIT